MKFRVGRISVIVLNVVATLGLLCLAIPYVRHDSTMLIYSSNYSMEVWNGAGFVLLLCLFPLLFINRLANKQIQIEHPLVKYACYLPTALCLLINMNYLFVY